MPGSYRIRLKKHAKKALNPGGMSPRRQRAVNRFVAEHLRVSPTDHIPGKTKSLRGRHTGLIQFDIDSDYRLHYTVDAKNRIVYIEYIGPHPKW